MANEVKEVRGVVEATAQNAPERYGLRVAGEWYDGFGSCPVEKGDQVAVVFSDSGRFHNVQDVRLAEPGAETEPERRAWDEAKDGRIARAVALKCAARLHESNWATAKEVLELAEKFESWLRADSK